MTRLYDTTDGNELDFVDSYALGAALEWSEDETNSVTQYLEREGLLRYPVFGGVVAITHFGVVEVEQARTSPDEPTEHFAPINVVYVAGDVVRSQIQAGTSDSTQEMSLEVQSQLPAIVELLSLFREAMQTAELSPEDSQVANASLVTVEAQLSSPKPNRHILREAVGSLRSIAEGMASSGAYVGLLELLEQIQL